MSADAKASSPRSTSTATEDSRGAGRQSRKALIVSSSFPYPKDIGRKVMLGGMVDFLVQELGPENVCFASLSSTPDATLPEVAFRVAPIDIGPASRRILAMVGGSLLLRRHALQEMAVYSPRAKRELAALTRSWQPGLVLLDTLRMAPYASAFSPRQARRVLYLDDLYSERYLRILDSMKRFPDADIDALGTFARFLPAALSRMAKDGFLARRLLTGESKLMAKQEVLAPSLFDDVLLISDHEAEKLRLKTGATNIRRINPRLNEPSRVAARSFDGRPIFVFLGNFDYPANAQALRHFLAKVMPGAIERIPDLQLEVIGKGVPQDILNLGDSFGKQVRFLGFVPDLAGALAHAAGMVVPLLIGTGVKLKTIDALAHGLPIISTPLGIEGTVLRDGLGCLIAERPEEFPPLMAQALDPETNARLSNDARRIFEAEYSAEALQASYRAIFMGGAASEGSAPSSSS